MKKSKKLLISLGASLASISLVAPIAATISSCSCFPSLIDASTFSYSKTTGGYCIDTLKVVDKSSVKSIVVPEEINGEKVVEISKGAFKGCCNLESITLPFIGHTPTSIGASGLFGYVFGDEKYDGCGTYTWQQWSTSDKYDDEECEWANFVIPSSLKEVNITGGSYIAPGAFSNCRYLRKINITNTTATEIGNYAFYGCMGLKGFTYPSTITTIGRRAFHACYNFKEIKIPKTVTTIKHNAFANCISAITAEVPDSVTVMGKQIFQNLISGLIKVGVDDQNLPVGWDSEWVSNTTPVVYGYDGGGIYYTSDAMIALCGKANEQFGFIIAWLGNWEAEEITIPETFTTSAGKTYPIKRIGPNVFLENEYVKKVNMGNNIEIISANAFQSCTKLETVNFGSTKIIGPRAFIGCNNLSKHTDADGNDVEGLYFTQVEKIYDSAFQEDQGITKVIFPFKDETTKDGYIKEIGTSAFQDCHYLSPLRTEEKDPTTQETTIVKNPIEFPSSLERIGEKAFYNICKIKRADTTYTKYKQEGDIIFNRNKSVEFEGVDIETSAFEYFGVRNTTSEYKSILRAHLNFNDIKLKNNEFKNRVFREAYLYGIYNFPQSVEIIGDSAFYLSYTYYTKEDTTQTDSRLFVIPNSVKKIGNYAFYYNCNMGFQFPNEAGELTTIGNNAFQNCSFAGTTTNPTGFKKLEITSKIKSIGSAAFAGCSQLREVTYPEDTDIDRIADSTFSGCTNLGYDSTLSQPTIPITIPKKITYIGANAFNGCKNMSKIKFEGDIQTIGSSCFAYCESLNQGAKIDETHYVEDSIVFKNKEQDGLQSVTSFGSNVYQQCASLVWAPFPLSNKASNITTIPGSTFADCKSLTNFYIQDRVGSIGGSAFRNCLSMDYVAGMTAVKTINANAFYGCENLVTFDMPRACNTIGDNAFANCVNLGTKTGEIEVTIPGSQQTKKVSQKFWLPADITQAYTTASPKGMGNSPFIGWTANQTIRFTDANIESTDESTGKITLRWGWVLVPNDKTSPTYYTCRESGSSTVHFVHENRS